jgi:uncharacterized protein (TIGR01777 family)
MRIAISGSSGLIGTALVEALEQAGHSVTPLVRPDSKKSGIAWDPQSGRIDSEALEGHDAVVHLAGESLVGIWTAARKRRILESRRNGTTLIATSLAKLRAPPAVFVSASAIGIYGDRPADERVDEESHRGPGFLADVVEVWEKATEPAAAAGVRVVNTRFGLVLSRNGGALAPMLPVFKLGLGGRLGSGQQMWSWVAIDDVVNAILFIIREPILHGPVNVVAPLPVTNAAFTRTLGRVLRRPTVLAVPKIALEALGDMGKEALLSGVRVVPRKLQEAGYEFKHPELEVALRDILAAL